MVGRVKSVAIRQLPYTMEYSHAKGARLVVVVS